MVLAALALLLATSDVIEPWTKVTFSVEMPSPYTEARVTALTEGTGENVRLRALELRLDGKAIAIPEVAFSDATFPHLDSLRVIHSPEGLGAALSFAISFEYGVEEIDDGEYPQIRIQIERGIVTGRWHTVLGKDGRYAHVFEKL